MICKFDGKWIPCKERLPEESGHYFVHTAGGYVTDMHFSKMYQKWNAYDCYEPKRPIEVVAWMYLPPKYEEK